MGMLVAGAAVVGLGAASLKMAGDFQTGLTTLVTGAGESEKNLKLVHDGLLQLSVDTATSTKQLTDGMYMIESAGYHGADGLNVLKVAAEGAKVGNADLGSVAFTLTGILHDYHMNADQATNAMNALTVTVGSGKMHMQDLSMALGTILPKAAALHIPFEQIAGAVAAMTNTNTSADLATQHLAFTITALSAPMPKAIKAMQEFGLTAQEVKDSLGQRGLAATFQLIEEHVGKTFPANSVQYVEAMKHILGGTVGWSTELALSGANMKDFVANTKNIGDALHQGGKDVTGFALVQKDFNFQLDAAHAAFNAVLIQVGEQLMPVLSHFLSDVVMPAIAHFQDWATHTSSLHDAFQTVVDVTGTLIGAAQTLFTWVGNVFQACQQGQPWVLAIASGLAAITTQIGLMKIEEWGAGVYNSFQKLQDGAGIVANLAAKSFPELNQALGWTKTSIAAIGPASVEAEAIVGTSALGMSTAMGLATGGISILVAAITAGIIYAVTNAKQAIDGMSVATQKSYDKLGTSAGDAAAKVKADAIETSTAWRNAGDQTSNRWGNTAQSLKKASADASAKMILDQQAIADAAAAAAQKAQDAWNAWEQQMLSQGIDPTGRSNHPIVKPTNVGKGKPSPTSTGIDQLPYTGHAAGILSSPVGHWAMVGERGPEPMYIPQGASVLPSGSGIPSGGGQPTQITLQIDGRTLAHVLLPHQVAALRSNLGVVGI